MDLMDMTDTAFAHQTGIAFASVYAIQLLKRSNLFPWLRTDTDTLNRVVSVVVAFATAAGIKFAMDGTFTTGETITIQVPSIGVILDTLVHFATQFGMQETIYRLTKQSSAPKAVPEAVPAVEAREAPSTGVMAHC
jgi:hypothetical protein